MKTDSPLKHDVQAELEWEPSIDHAHIGVAVTAGVVTLTGQVSNYAQKLAAEKAVHRVAGVHALAEEIKVRYPGDRKTSDTEIAKRIRDIFDWDVTIPADEIDVKVEQGWVTLTGTVHWHYQSEAARKAAGKIHGVLGVYNMLTFRQAPTASDVRERIVAAFKRNADLDAAAITVATDGGTVTLDGTVHNWRERRIAEQAAWAAPGVVRIDDKLAIA